MARQTVRLLFVGAAVLGVAAVAAGSLLTLQGGRWLAGWQLTCIGVGIPTAVLGLLIAWHQPGNRIAWLFLGASVSFGLEQLGLAVLTIPTAAAWVQASAYALLLLVPGPLTSVWVMLVLLFPDGRFFRQVWRNYGLLAVLVAIAASLAQFLVAPPGYLPQQYGLTGPSWLAGPLAPSLSTLSLARALDVPGLLLPAIALVALLDRYRHTQASVRQQIKWPLFGVCLEVAVQLLFIPVLWLGIEEPAALSVLVAPFPTIGAALAVFKYRLWDLDRLLLRTLAFAVLWLASSAAFVGLAALAGLSLNGADGRLLTAVMLSLLVALVLQPLRGRLEAGIRQMVYGPRPRGYAALAHLGNGMAGLLPVGQLAEAIATTAMDATGVEWASVWLQMEVDGRYLLRLAGEARADQSRTPDTGRVELELWGEPSAAPSLDSVLPETAGAVVPLESSGEFIGFLACGRREGRDLVADDRQVLMLVARQATVLLRSRRLEAELEQRVDDLRESRQRLVSIQDAQRRQIERDLHDGVQQQLVSLAAKIRQLSRLGGLSTPAELELLAEQAEEAVFAMQDLARGIYPSVLADQGLAAALRTQAVRLPLEVRLEIEPGLAAARFELDVETCLYFVAMEALANAQKHSNCSAVTVSFRRHEQPRGLVLEVHDNGRGFIPEYCHPGSGLQNMRDRLAALDGQIRVRSEPGAGTWIEARLPDQAEMLPFQRPGIVSRR